MGDEMPHRPGRVSKQKKINWSKDENQALKDLFPPRSQRIKGWKIEVISKFLKSHPNKEHKSIKTKIDNMNRKKNKPTFGTDHVKEGDLHQLIGYGIDLYMSKTEKVNIYLLKNTLTNLFFSQDVRRFPIFYHGDKIIAVREILEELNNKDESKAEEFMSFLKDHLTNKPKEKEIESDYETDMDHDTDNETDIEEDTENETDMDQDKEDETDFDKPKKKKKSGNGLGKAHFEKNETKESDDEDSKKDKDGTDCEVQKDDKSEKVSENLYEETGANCKDSHRSDTSMNTENATQQKKRTTSGSGNQEPPVKKNKKDDNEAKGRRSQTSKKNKKITDQEKLIALEEENEELRQECERLKKEKEETEKIAMQNDQLMIENDQLKSENKAFEKKNKTLQLELIDIKEKENRVKTRFQQLMGNLDQAMIMAKKDQ